MSFTRAKGLIIASNSQTTSSSYFCQVTERTLHFSGINHWRVSLILKGKTCDACRCGSLYKWFPRKCVVCKGKCELEQWWCPSVADVRRQTQSRHAAVAVGRGQQKNLEGALLCKRRTSVYGATEPAEPNKMARVVTFRLLFVRCPSQIQAEDYDEIFHSKSSKQIPRWYIKIRYDCFLSLPLEFINHYHSTLYTLGYIVKAPLNKQKVNTSSSGSRQIVSNYEMQWISHSTAALV